MSSSLGFFISIDGGEGAGKGTQAARLVERLRAIDAYTDRVVTVRDPGGTPDSEKIRNLLVQRDGGNWFPRTEMLLYFAARVQMTEQVIWPALNQGHIVVSDRYTDSTRAYQAYGRGHSLETINAINQAVLGDFEPDLTFILDLPADLGLTRANRQMSTTTDERRKTEDRFERLGLEFHSKVRQGYLDVARMYPHRCVVIDATQNVDKVAEELWTTVEQRMTARGQLVRA